MPRQLRKWEDLSPRETIVASGADDWQHLGNLFEACFDHAPAADFETLRGQVVSVIRDLLTNNLMVAGDVDRDGFKAWELSAEQTTAQIADRLRGITIEDVAPGAVVWLDLTSEGEELAAQLLNGLEPW